MAGGNSGGRAWLAVVVLLACSSVLRAGTTTTQASSAADRAWARVRAAESAAHGAKPDSEWLWEVVAATGDEFWRMLAATPDVPTCINAYVGRFGCDGGEADIAWMASSSQLLCYDRVPGAGDKDKTPEQRGDTALDRIICEAEVRRFIASPPTLDRYYRACVRAGTLFWPGERRWEGFVRDVSSLRARFAKKEHPDYWCLARQVVVLVHASGRDDLLKDADPRKLDEVFAKWNEWAGDRYQITRHMRYDGDGERWRVEPAGLPNLLPPGDPPLSGQWFDDARTMPNELMSAQGGYESGTHRNMVEMLQVVRCLGARPTNAESAKAVETHKGAATTASTRESGH